MQIHLSLIVVLLGLLLNGCSGSHDSSSPTTAPAAYDFTEVDDWLTRFVMDEENFDGASIIIVHRDNGVLHTASFGDHTTDSIFMLASVSKVPSVSLLMALADDPELDFDIDTPIENYLPWLGVYPGITAAHLVSNTSGIPGLLNLTKYGDHLCQYGAAGQIPNAEQLLTCAQAIYQTPLEGTVAPGTAFDYGGSQWHLAGAVAEVVGGDSWANLYREYISEPCDLEVFEYGNMFFNLAAWTGYPDSLMGRSNPNIEGGAISNLQDMAKLLRMHLNEGRCGDEQVISEADARRMRVDIGTALGSGEWLTGGGRGYGLGWWVPPVADGETPTHFQDPGAFGSVSWIDIGRGYGAFVALSQYEDLLAARQGPTRIIPELIPMIDDAMDNPQ